MKTKLEYIWIDGNQPEGNLRSKTKIASENFSGKVEDCSQWSYDGSSTKQAEGNFSDCLLQPVSIIPDPERVNAYLVFCEVLNPDGSVHKTNTRNGIKDDPDFWFGFEQEYTLTVNNRPLGFPEEGYPGPQGPYYCAVGHGNVAGRDIVEEHLDICLEAGLEITGINAEVMLGQWEFQVIGKGAKKAGDDLWFARYFLFRLTERYGMKVEFHPKPVEGDWNGSGLHTNFSNKKMREVGGEAYMKGICDAFGEFHKEHIAVYGSLNEQRLTGLHETADIDTFSYGVSDRGASIRIPVGVVQDDWKGYLEDRRPASNADPYQIVDRIIQTVKTAKLATV